MINTKIMNLLIDHTILKPETTKSEVERVCEEALQYNFCSVCVNGAWVPLVREKLEGSSIKICAVIGFPLGANSTLSKSNEAKDVIISGANEVDMVINVGFLKSKMYEEVLRDIAEVAQVVHERNAILKVILETCLLSEEEIIKGCELSVNAGADFVKTSTGFSSGGATIHNVQIMRSAVGPLVGVKASGGIRTFEDASRMVEAGANRLGCSSSVAIVKTALNTLPLPPSETLNNGGY